MLHNFVICGHISYQQESSQRATLDLSNCLWHMKMHYNICQSSYHALVQKWCQNTLNPMEKGIGGKPKVPHRSHMLINSLK